MTLAQIEKIRETVLRLNSLRTAPSLKEVREINSFLNNYFQNKYPTPSLWVNNIYSEDDKITNDCLLSDIGDIVSTLEGMIASDAKTGEVMQILDLISESKSLKTSYEDKQKYISKAYFRYGDKIKFDKSISSIANKSIKTDIDIDFGFHEENSIDDTVIDGVNYRLRSYCQNILEDKLVKPIKESSKPTIDFHPTINATATATNTVDISIFIDQARKQVEDAGLADDQHKAVMDKLNEIEEIAKSKENKGKRWTKAKEILKWVAEQGITVAGIILPLLAPMIG